jgi:CRP/FNR family cyclic AMP-dependent transcriptional regulator
MANKSKKKPKSAPPVARASSAMRRGPSPKTRKNAHTALSPFAVLAAIGRGHPVEKYNKGDTIFLQGDAANAVFFIQSGKVQISIVSEHGKERVVADIEAGAFLGEGCLAGQILHLGTAKAAEPSSIVTIDKPVMLRALADEPQFAKLFMTYILARNIQVEADLIDHLFNSSEKRLARVLLMLSNIGAQGVSQEIPSISQEVLAARVGTTRSRINLFMNKFRKLGFIEYNGTLKVHQSLINVIVHE